MPRIYSLLKRAKKWASLILMVLLLLYIINYIIKNWHEFLILQSIHLLNVGYLFVIFFFTTMVSAIRMLMVNKKFGLKNITLPNWLRIFILARFFNRVVPQGGNLYRALILKNHHGFSFKNYTLSFISFTWIDLLVNFVLISIVIILFHPGLKIGNIDALTVSMVLALGLAALPAVFYLLLKPGKIRPGGKVFSSVVKNLEYTITTTLHGGFLLKVIFLSLLSAALVILWFWTGFQSIGIQVSLGELAIFNAIMRLGLIASITPGNIGIIELAYGYLSAALGFEFSMGLIIAVITRTVSFTAILVLGALFGGIPLVKSLKSSTNPDKD